MAKEVAFPKPHAKRAKYKKRITRFVDDDHLRDLIWQREDGKDRATGEPLWRSSLDERRRGEVCHIKPKGKYPELRHETGNAVLLSAYHHRLSDGRDGYKLKIEGASADGALTFRMTNAQGDVLWERTTTPRCPLVSPPDG